MDLDRYNESLDFVASPKFQSLTQDQQRRVTATYENAYRSSIHMGQQIAVGKAVRNAIELIEQFSKAGAYRVEQPVPASIFAGLDNCQ